MTETCSTSQPAVAVPTASPPKIMLPFQAKASVVVPLGAAAPRSTELDALKGAMVVPNRNSTTPMATGPVASRGKRVPADSAATSRGSCSE